MRKSCESVQVLQQHEILSIVCTHSIYCNEISGSIYVKHRDVRRLPTGSPFPLISQPCRITCSISRYRSDRFVAYEDTLTYLRCVESALLFRGV